MRSLVFHAPLVDIFELRLLPAFEIGLRMAIAQRQVHVLVGPDVGQCLTGLEADRGRIDQQGLGRVEAEAFDVEVLDVVIEAVVLRRVHRIEVVDLHEVQARHVGLRGRIDARFFEDLTRLQLVPTRHQTLNPPNEMLGALARRQADDASGVVLHPLDEAHGRQLAQGREVLDHNRGDLLGGAVQNVKRGGCDSNLLYRCQCYRCVVFHDSSSSIPR